MVLETKPPAAANPFEGFKPNFGRKTVTITFEGEDGGQPTSHTIPLPGEGAAELVGHFVDSMDISKYLERFSRFGRSPTGQRMMLKILVYANTQGVRSTRGAERLCKTGAGAIWLLGGERAPDHSTISRHRAALAEGGAMDALGQQAKMLLACEEITLGEVFQDGTKLESFAGRYTFVWRGSVEKYLGKALAKARASAAEASILLGQAPESWAAEGSTGEVPLAGLASLAISLRGRMAFCGVEAVAGKGKRKSDMQRAAEGLEALVLAIGRYRGHLGVMGEGRNSYSKTDPDATFMRMKDDHMRNGQLKPAYNLQFAVASEYIVGATLSQDRNDMATLRPMIELLASFDLWFERYVADSGYDSEENFELLEIMAIAAFITPSDREARKKKSFKNKVSRRENMAYDEASDTCTCANGKALHFTGTKKRKSRTGYVSEVSTCRCESCEGCPYKGEPYTKGEKAKVAEKGGPKPIICSRAKGDKVMEVSKRYIVLRERSRLQVESCEGALLRVNRSIQSEGAFSAFKCAFGFNRLFTKGLELALCEVALQCLAMNVMKLLSKKKRGKLGSHLHPLKE